ncbi:MAG: hypothetical protein COA52_05390 [Hyphomicrobiales bacterium]|nr:MAG: hypothetical protein COA52_05390 [Hyphomicrobiales bacterium]
MSMQSKRDKCQVTAPKLYFIILPQIGSFWVGALNHNLMLYMHVVPRYIKYFKYLRKVRFASLVKISMAKTPTIQSWIRSLEEEKGTRKNNLQKHLYPSKKYTETLP